IMNMKPSTEVVLLDDAYQHRKISAGFYILLTAYDELYINDLVLPAGNLRESRRNAKRSNIIVVTKCPADLSVNEQESIIKKIKKKKKKKNKIKNISYLFIKNIYILYKKKKL